MKRRAAGPAHAGPGENVMTPDDHTHAATEVVDPVCGMTIAPEDAVGHVEHNGQTYYFCSESCLHRFRADPEKFLRPGTAGHASQTNAQIDYTCPMHQEVRQQGPGACPNCGMA